MPQAIQWTGEMDDQLVTLTRFQRLSVRNIEGKIRTPQGVIVSKSTIAKRAAQINAAGDSPRRKADAVVSIGVLSPISGLFPSLCGGVATLGGMLA